MIVQKGQVLLSFCGVGGMYFRTSCVWKTKQTNLEIRIGAPLKVISNDINYFHKHLSWQSMEMIEVQC